MKLKPLLIAVGLLGIASVITYFASRRESVVATDARIGQPLLSATPLQSTSRIRITDSGRTVLLAKEPNGTWRVPSYHDLPATFSKISQFLAEFVGTKVERLVSTRQDRIATLGFADTRVELLDASDKVVWSVTLGKPSGNGGYFLRFGDEPKAYFAPLNTYLDTEAMNWTEQRLLQLSADDIARVELTFPKENTTVTASRPTKDDVFVAANPPGGRKLRFDAVPNLVNYFSSLRFSTTSESGNPEATAARADLRKLTLTTFAGKAYTIEMAVKPEAKPATPDGKSASDSAVPEGTNAAEPKAEPRDDVPTGPVYVWISSSDAAASVNALMKLRTFQISEYLYASLPKKADDLFEAPAGTTVNQ